jgi:hypothetical protein
MYQETQYAPYLHDLQRKTFVLAASCLFVFIIEHLLAALATSYLSFFFVFLIVLQDYDDVKEDRLSDGEALHGQEYDENPRMKRSTLALSTPSPTVRPYQAMISSVLAKSSQPLTD